MDAASLAEKLLATDPTILRVLVLDELGQEITHVYSGKYPEKARLGTEAEKRFGTIDTITLQMFEQAEKKYGTMDFILLAFKDAKVMLIQDKKHGLYLALRILRSANAEYLRIKLEPIISRT